MSQRPKRQPDFRVNVQLVNGYVFSHAFTNYCDARRCFEKSRVLAFTDAISDVRLVNEREQRVLDSALNEAKAVTSALGLDL